MAQDAAKMYDLLYIVPNKYTENEVPQVMKTINDVIVKFNGKVTKEVNYGKRRLAYPVEHNHYGYYILDRFEAMPKDAQALNTALRVQDEIMRHLITTSLKEGTVPVEADLKQVELPPQAPAEKPASRRRPSIVDVAASGEEKEKIKKGSSFDIEKELGVTAKQAEESLAATPKQEDKSVDMKALDTKLDEIMKDFE